jgi:hypothetical protein
VRDGGLAALKQPANRERISRCDATARAELREWCARFKTSAAA